MPIKSIEILLTRDAQWALEYDPDNPGPVYPSRDAAIAAGLQLAMTHDAVLTIHGINDKSDAFDFRELHVPLLH
ncbi:hypothetical protein D9M68_90690 [compost metagenome]|jgi:hypothetical protein|uniref:DUF2188 domain-containing protein n=1 Tax=Cupriavidus necator TaxID=106590 RepID=UPI0028B4C02C